MEAVQLQPALPNTTTSQPQSYGAALTPLADLEPCYFEVISSILHATEIPIPCIWLSKPCDGDIVNWSAGIAISPPARVGMLSSLLCSLFSFEERDALWVRGLESKPRLIHWYHKSWVALVVTLAVILQETTTQTMNHGR
ncbi:hypothetical protein HAX54_022452 [Datura stramonium]|uniref:Uncharacterized protein n=1 Tax=Datura stramonium TaxID=4076 RepID=A0ABS8UWT3_DATST|nr:hypothetical protein [Datura stramonium]